MTLLLLFPPQLDWPNTFLHLESAEILQHEETQILREAPPSSPLLGGRFWIREGETVGKTLMVRG